MSKKLFSKRCWVFITFFLALFLASGGSAYGNGEDEEGEINLTVFSTPSPNPALTGQTISTTFNINLDAVPKAHEE